MMPKVKEKEEYPAPLGKRLVKAAQEANTIAKGDASSQESEIDELHDRINNLEFLNKVVTSDLQRSNLLLREVLSQLYKDKDEYHADLHDKIVKELGE